MRLRSKLLLFSLPLILVPLLLVSSITYLFVIGTYAEREDERTAAGIRASLVGVNELITNSEKQIETLGSAPVISEYLAAETSGEIRYKIQAKRMIEAYLERDNFILDVSLLNERGKPVLTSTRLEGGARSALEGERPKQFRRVMVVGATQSPSIDLGDGRYAAVFWKPVSSGKFVGMVAVAVDTRAFAQPLRARVLEGFGIACFDGRGVVWLSLSPSGLSPGAFKDVGWKRILPLMSDEQDQAPLQAEVDGRTSDLLAVPISDFSIEGTMSLAPGESWYLGVIRPRNVPPGMRTFQFSFIAILALSVISVIWASSAVARRITNPIERVSRATARIAQGETDLELEVDTGDEVEDLAQAVEKMNSDLSLYQKRIVDSARMAAMGEATSEISHEIQNRISGISLWLQHLDAEISPEDERKEYIDEMKLGLEGFVEMLAGLKRFYRKPKVSETEFPLDDVLREAADSVRNLAEEGEVRVLCNSDNPSAIFSGDREAVKGVLMNLLINAIEASPAGAEVGLSLAESGDEYQITITDQGQGIAEADRDHVFSPFFTTKSSGSGLGLAISNNVVSAHGGSILIGETGPTGTRLIVNLPLNGKKNGKNPLD